MNSLNIDPKNSIDRSPLQRSFLVGALALTWFTLLPTARAADGNVGDGTNTAEGAYALFSLTTGGYNTATGYASLYSLTASSRNTANGALALFTNSTGSNNVASG